MIAVPTTRKLEDEALAGRHYVCAAALTIAPAGDAHVESKASALACRSKAEALDSRRPVPQLAGTMTKARDGRDHRSGHRVDKRQRSPPIPAPSLVDCAALIHPTKPRGRKHDHRRRHWLGAAPRGRRVRPAGAVAGRDRGLKSAGLATGGGSGGADR